MKRILALMLSVSIAALYLVGCAAPSQEEAPPPGLRTGIGIIGSSSDSTSAGDKEGTAEADVTAVAVLLSGEGVILKCRIDQVQAKMSFDSAGQPTVAKYTSYLSKVALGDGYGMRAASSLGREWFEQAEAFAAYCEGKTLEQIKGLALNERGAPAEADLGASVTLSIGSFLGALEKAVHNAMLVHPGESDRLGLSMLASVGEADAATADKSGRLQANVTCAAVTVGADGRITSTIIDEMQVPIAFTASGQLVAESASPISKLEAWDSYGMQAASAIGKEWHDQLAALSVHTLGKTVDEVGGIAVGQGGKIEQADLAASITLYAGNFIASVQAAAASAR